MSANFKIAFITGQSNKKTNALSPIQTHFLQEIDAPEANKVFQNFPYVHPLQPFSEVGLFSASINNSRQYLQSRRPAFQRKYNQLFMEAFGGTDKIILLSGSCGMELYNNLKLPEAIKEKTYLFAYGAVARKLPSCKKVCVVRGTHDWIAALWALPYDTKIPAGHLDYLEKDALKIQCGQFINSVLHS